MVKNAASCHKACHNRVIKCDEKPKKVALCHAFVTINWCTREKFRKVRQNFVIFLMAPLRSFNLTKRDPLGQPGQGGAPLQLAKATG